MTSIMFIAYFTAGGAFPDTTVRLQIINATFQKPIVLAIIAWIVFFWLIYRYWLYHRQRFSESFWRELQELTDRKYLRRYVERCLGEPLAPLVRTDDPNDEQALTFDRIVLREGRYVIPVALTEIGRDSVGKINSTSTRKGWRSEVVELSGVRGHLVKLKLVSDCAFNYPSFSDYMIPYLLALIAIVSGLVRVAF